MLQTLAKLATQQLNFFLAKKGVSAYYSPYMLLNKHSLNYVQHCWYAFGSYVQAYQEDQIKNNNKQRTFDAIYLKPKMPLKADIVA